MAIISLSEAKSHLRVDQSSEDALIQLYIDAAVDYVRTFLNSDIEGETDSPVSTPASIKAAILLIVGDLYENRESQSEKDYKPNASVMSLLYPHRVNIGV